MVSKNTTLISVNKTTKENLDKLKLHPSLSYNDVIVQLLEVRDKAIIEIDNLKKEFAKDDNVDASDLQFKTDTSTGN